LLALCIELATEGKLESNRQLAGIYIKNLITAQVRIALNIFDDFFNFLF
jgi:hypothetical protein